MSSDQEVDEEITNDEYYFSENDPHEGNIQGLDIISECDSNSSSDQYYDKEFERAISVNSRVMSYLLEGMQRNQFWLYL